MVSFLAPIVMALVLSGMLYKTNAVWGKHEYDLESHGWNPDVAEDFAQMADAVKRGVVEAGDADTIMRSKGHGAQGGRKMTDADADLMAHEAVRAKAQQSMRIGKDELRR